LPEAAFRAWWEYDSLMVVSFVIIFIVQPLTQGFLLHLFSFKIIEGMIWEKALVLFAR